MGTRPAIHTPTSTRRTGSTPPCPTTGCQCGKTPFPQFPPPPRFDRQPATTDETPRQCAAPQALSRCGQARPRQATDPGDRRRLSRPDHREVPGPRQAASTSPTSMRSSSCRPVPVTAIPLSRLRARTSNHVISRPRHCPARRAYRLPWSWPPRPPAEDLRHWLQTPLRDARNLRARGPGLPAGTDWHRSPLRDRALCRAHASSSRARDAVHQGNREDGA